MTMRYRMPARLRVLSALACTVVLLAGCSAEDANPAKADASPTVTSATNDRPATGASALRYVALGDSFTSAPLVGVTDLAEGCLRSSANYPTLVAKRLGAELRDRSCAGAVTRNLYHPQRERVAPQIDAVTEDTDLVTLGIGGNDEGVFATIVGHCARVRPRDPGGAPCRRAMSRTGAAPQGDRLLAALARTEKRVVRAVRQIRARAPSATILLVGYPEIVPQRGTCPARLPLARGDYPYTHEINRRLSRVLERVAERTDNPYVDTWSASRGHDVCSDDPWVKGQRTEQGTALAYHPLAEEQIAVADLVLAQAPPATTQAPARR